MAFQLAPFLARSVPGVGVLGGIVGGAGALAEGLKAKERGEAGFQPACRPGEPRQDKDFKKKIGAAQSFNRAKAHL